MPVALHYYDCPSNRVIDLPDEYAEMLSAFVLYTWVADRLPTAVYLSVVGLPQSGKSTLLELLSLLCRRALLVERYQPGGSVQACSNFGSTLLIDELDWHCARTLEHPSAPSARRNESCFASSTRPAKQLFFWPQGLRLARTVVGLRFE